MGAHSAGFSPRDLVPVPFTCTLGHAARHGGSPIDWEIVMGTFELPKFKGIEEAIQDVKAYGLANKKEKLIALRKDGSRVFEVGGSDHDVCVPDDKKDLCHGALLVHCHPSMPTELSDADIFCIYGTKAWGNLAICCQDDTTSWTRGLRPDLCSSHFMFAMFVEPALSDLTRHVIAHIAKNEGKHIDCQQKWDQYVQSWSEEDDRYLAVSHLFNKTLAKKGLLIDYHLRLGDKASSILAKRGFNDV